MSFEKRVERGCVMIEKVNVRKLSQVQREACDLLRLFKRRAGWDVGRDIVYPIILKQVVV